MDRTYIIILMTIGAMIGWIAKYYVGSSNSFHDGYKEGFISGQTRFYKMLLDQCEDKAVNSQQMELLTEEMIADPIIQKPKYDS